MYDLVLYKMSCGQIVNADFVKSSLRILKLYVCLDNLHKHPTEEHNKQTYNGDKKIANQHPHRSRGKGVRLHLGNLQKRICDSKINNGKG